MSDPHPLVRSPPVRPPPIGPTPGRPPGPLAGRLPEGLTELRLSLRGASVGGDAGAAALGKALPGRPLTELALDLRAFRGLGRCQVFSPPGHDRLSIGRESIAVIYS